MLSNTKTLLESTKVLIQKQNEFKKLNGGLFNVFSILKMERKEVRTHTPFIFELLNPKGSHNKGSLFLKLFLETIEYKNFPKAKDFILEGAWVEQNKYLGGILVEDGFESGGNIDIYIEDKNKVGFTIENKIDEYTEQERQVLRYYNFNKDLNTVLYLTPLGTEPSKYSKGELISKNQFYCISYQKHILEWLSKCLNESLDYPILRESLVQYINVIKKITNTMEENEIKEANELMLQYFEESEFISENYIKLKERIGEDFRQLLKPILEEKFGNEFNIHMGGNTSSVYSQIWIKFKEFDTADLFFGVESFSYLKSSSLDVGVFNIKGNETEFTNGKKSYEPYWPYYQTLNTFEGIAANFNESQTLHKLYIDKEFERRFINHVVSEIESFINIHKVQLRRFLASK